MDVRRHKDGCYAFLTMEQLRLNSSITSRSPFPMYKIELLETTVGDNESLEIRAYCGLIYILKNLVYNVVQESKSTLGSWEVF